MKSMKKALKKGDNPLYGIALMLSAMLAFSAMDVISKRLAVEYSPIEIAFARYAVLALAMVPYIVRSRGAVLRTARPGLQCLRGFFMAATTACFVFGLASLPLADTTAIGFASPLLATVLSALILKERIGFGQWAAVGLGFLGILVAVRPGAASFDPAALMPLAAALFWASGLVVSRVMKESEPPLTTLAYTALAGSAVLLLPVVLVWTTPVPVALGLALVTGLVTTFGHWALILSVQYAPPSVVAPFVYSQIIWATLFGAFFFGVLPDAATGIGAAIVVACGLYTIQRERDQASAPA